MGQKNGKYPHNVFSVQVRLKHHLYTEATSSRCSELAKARNAGCVGCVGRRNCLGASARGPLCAGEERPVWRSRGDNNRLSLYCTFTICWNEILQYILELRVNTDMLLYMIAKCSIFASRIVFDRDGPAWMRFLLHFCDF